MGAGCATATDRRDNGLRWLRRGAAKEEHLPGQKRLRLLGHDHLLGLRGGLQEVCLARDAGTLLVG